jgi:hypothetical protein
LVVGARMTIILGRALGGWWADGTRAADSSGRVNDRVVDEEAL